MSHRQMKKADSAVQEMAGRLHLMENILVKLLARENLRLGMVDGEFALVDAPAEAGPLDSIDAPEAPVAE